MKKEVVKLLLFEDDTILEIQKDSTEKEFELINKFQ